MSSVATARLMEERKNFRKDRPYQFVAKPNQKPGGEVDLLHWKCVVPGKKDTIWEGGFYPVDLHFPKDYPTAPPEAKFPAGFFHPNIYPSGKVCLSILNADADMGGQYAPSLTIKQLLLGIQALLEEPNIYSPAHQEASQMYQHKREEYNKRVRQQAGRYPMQDE